MDSVVEDPKEIIVPMGKFEVAHNPHILTALGLGSCVGVALYDSESKIGALAHVMLADSKKFGNQTDLEKFADVAVPRMMEQMIKMGAKKENIKAKIAGGAEMFPDLEDVDLQISAENVVSVKMVLSNEKIPLISTDTGGYFGRTVKLYTINGSVEVIIRAKEKSYFI